MTCPPFFTYSMSSFLHVLHVLLSSRTPCPPFFTYSMSSFLHVLHVLLSSRTTCPPFFMTCPPFSTISPPLNSESLSHTLNSLPSNSFFRVSSFLFFSYFPSLLSFALPFFRVSSSFFWVPYHLSLNSPHNLSSRGPVEHERRPAKMLGTEDDIKKQLSKFFQLMQLSPTDIPAC